MEVAVLIGGCGDGHRKAVYDPPLPYIEVATPERIGLMDLRAANEPVTVSRDSYRLEWLRCGARRFPLYIVRHMSMETAVERLLDRYKDGRP
jgi:hypothetical protein